MIGISEIAAENFCQFKQFSVSFDGLGLAWVGGENLDTDAAQSNGAGKSNFLKSIGWCLFGDTPEPEAADDVIREGAKSTVVRMALTNGWIITRERRPGKPRLTLVDNDVLVKRDPKTLQEKIIRELGLDWRSFLNVAFYAQRDTKRFLDPRTTNAERQSIIFKITRRDRVTGALKHIKLRATALETRIESLRERERVLVEQRKTSDLKRLRLLGEGYEKERRAKVKRLRSEIKEARQVARTYLDQAKGKAATARRIADLKAKLERVTARDRRGIDLQPGLDKLNVRVYDLENAATVLEGRASERLSELAKLKADGRCPLCQRGLRGVSGARHLASERTKAKSWRTQAAEKRRIAARVQSRSKKLRDRIAKLRAVRPHTVEGKIMGEQGVLGSKRYAATMSRRSLETVQRCRTEIDALRAECNPYEVEIAQAKGKRAKLKAEIERTRQDIEAASWELAHVDFWKAGFGPSGMPSHMLDEVMPFLTDRCNHYLNLLADGDISVAFSTQRQLRSKRDQFRDEINIQWVIEGVENKPPSGGQWRKMEISSDLALMDLASERNSGSLDFLALDEIFDGGIDAVGVKRLVTLLHEIRKERSNIFVVSHDKQLAEIFQAAIHVRKKNGISTVEVRK